MIFRLLVLILLPVLAYFAVRSASIRFNLNSRQSQLLFVIVAALLVVAVLILMGRLPIHFILAPLSAAAAFLLRFLPTLLRLLPFWQMLRSRTVGGASASTDQTSTIRTEFLLMELQHDSGDMEGEVLRGKFRQRKLSELQLTELRELLDECQHDSDSQQVLEAYLDRTQANWREGYEGQGNESGQMQLDDAQMTRELALEVLGLETGADAEEISKAHRALMQKLHPDRGGSDYLAKKINAAKDFLLKN